MQSLADEAPQQLVPRRVELDFIAALAEAIERVQLRRVAVGRLAECEHLGTAKPLTERGECGVFRRRAFARQRLLKG
jgi:hypothetical protein